MSRKVKVNWWHFSGGTYLQLSEHADAKRIHSFKFGMEIANRLKFTLLQKLLNIHQVTGLKNVVNRAIKVTCIHTNGEVYLLKTWTEPSLTLPWWLEMASNNLWLVKQQDLCSTTFSISSKTSTLTRPNMLMPKVTDTIFRYSRDLNFKMISLECILPAN